MTDNVLPMPERKKPLEIETMLGLCTNKVLCDHAKALEAEIERLRHGLSDTQSEHDRLVRALDLALSGPEGIAKQASLCDLIGPALHLRDSMTVAKAALEKCVRAFKADALPPDKSGDVTVYQLDGPTCGNALNAARAALAGMPK